MLIETTLNIGDTVWFVHENQIKSGTVEMVNFNRHISHLDFETVEQDVTYEIFDGERYYRHTVKDLYLDKETLINNF